MPGPGIVNTVRLKQILADYGNGVNGRRGRAMARALDVLETKAVELAPVDTGNLEAATSTDITETRTKTIGTLAFSTPYAARVHELPDESRGPKTQAKLGNELGPAGPKYLERALRGVQRLLPQILRENVFGKGAS